MWYAKSVASKYSWRCGNRYFIRIKWLWLPLLKHFQSNTYKFKNIDIPFYFGQFQLAPVIKRGNTDLNLSYFWFKYLRMLSNLSLHLPHCFDLSFFKPNNDNPDAFRYLVVVILYMICTSNHNTACFWPLLVGLSFVSFILSWFLKHAYCSKNKLLLPTLTPDILKTFKLKWLVYLRLNVVRQQ